MTAFDRHRPSSFLIYLDPNYLYGWEMSQPMLIGRFEWMSA